MRIVIAPDSFKGSLSAKEVCQEVGRAAREVFKDCEIIEMPVADGGEGTLNGIIDSLKGEYIQTVVQNPLGEEIQAHYGIFEGNKAVIEMAQASGLPLIPESQRDIMKASTYGTGQMILDAMERGCVTIYVGLGGSATNDGGMGCAAALGVRFLDEHQKALEALPKNFSKIEQIDLSGLDPRVKDTTFIIMSDVKNPLTGPQGATYIYGAQKGATKAQQRVLEAGMVHYIQKVEEALGCRVSQKEGAGAAGGLGAGLMAFTGAVVRSGIEQVLDILHFEECIKTADLVITGEGRMDEQSAYGKVAAGIGKACKKHHKPCLAIVGGMGKGAEKMFNYGIDSIITTVNDITTLEQAMENAHELCYGAAVRMLRMVKVGKDL